MINIRTNPCIRRLYSKVFTEWSLSWISEWPSSCITALSLPWISKWSTPRITALSLSWITEWSLSWNTEWSLLGSPNDPCTGIPNDPCLGSPYYPILDHKRLKIQAPAPFGMHFKDYTSFVQKTTNPQITSCISLYETKS